MLSYNISVKSKGSHLPPGETPGDLTFSKKNWSNAHYVGIEFTWSNARPVRALQSVKYPTLQARR